MADSFKGKPGHGSNTYTVTPITVSDHVCKVGTDQTGYDVYNRESTVGGNSTWRWVRREPANSR